MGARQNAFKILTKDVLNKEARATLTLLRHHSHAYLQHKHTPLLKTPHMRVSTCHASSRLLAEEMHLPAVTARLP
jgi:hypothetical protein